MSGYCRTVLLSTLCRSIGVIRQPCSKIFNHNRPFQAQSIWLLNEQHNRSQCHHWSVRHTRAALNVKSRWTSSRSSHQSSEAGVPFKEEDYPPLPEYKENAEPESKEVYIVRLKGLPWNCKKEDLLDFFSECRIREGVKGIHFMHFKDGRPNGQAFLEMETEEDVSKALERHRQYLGPRYIEVFEVTEQDAEAILKGNVSPEADGGVVRLRGLPFSCTEKDIIQFFSGLDIVENGVTLVLNSRGQSTGQAYVEFATPEMGDKALERDKEVIGHRYVEIFSSSKTEIVSQRRRKAQEPNTASPNRIPPPDTHHAIPSASETTGIQRHRSGRSAASQGSVSPIHFVHMRGLPYETTGEDIVQFFSPLRVARIMMEFHSDGKPSGEAEVHFRSHEDAVAAMSKDKDYMQNRYIELFLNSQRGQS